MADRWIKFPDIKFKAVLGAGPIPERMLNRIGCPVDALPLNAGIRIGRKNRDEDRLKDVHDRMMDDPIGKVR